MNAYLQNTLEAKLHTTHPELIDFHKINKLFEFKNLNTKRTRGSVRMQLNKILTPSDIGKKLQQLSSIVLPK